MPKGVPNKRYTAEFKKQVIETMRQEGLSYSETSRRFEINSHRRVQDWERIYLTEGPEGFTIERRGHGSTDRPKKLPKEVEEDLTNSERVAWKPARANLSVTLLPETIPT